MKKPEKSKFFWSHFSLSIKAEQVHIEKSGEMKEGNITNVYENSDAKLIFCVCLKTEGWRHVR